MSNEEKKHVSLTVEELLLKQNELAIARETREAAEYEEKQAEAREKKLHRAARIADKLLREARTTAKNDNNKSRCRHEQGLGAFKRPNPAVSAIYVHQLPSGAFIAGCRSVCQMIWRQGDTREYIFRNNKKLPNPTRMSFEDAIQASASSNNDAISRSAVALVTPAAALATA